MRLGHQKIVRDGNHFIRFKIGKDVGWVLIDGPWYDTLSGLGSQHVKIPVVEPLQARVTGDLSELSPYADFRWVTWERVKWAGRDPAQRVPYLSAVWHKVVEIMYPHRYKYGWRILPDGRLPVNLQDLDPHLDHPTPLE